MKDLFLRLRNDRLAFDLPPDWRLRTFAAFEDRPDPGDPVDLTRKALQNPIGHARLSVVLHGSEHVAIIIEDPSRASPKQQVLRAVIQELEAAGISGDRIVVVLGLGTHRRIEAAEMKRVYGADLVETYEFVNHDCQAADLVPIGRLRSGSQVKINPRVHAADFTIGIGSIFPHPMNGFGGGGKILFPAVANFDAILEHHLQYCFRGGSGLGILTGNPFYEEVSALTRAAGLNVIVNSVLDHNDKLYQVVFGDPIAAHEAGVAISRQILTMPFHGRSDVTVISSFPYSEGTQIMKPFAPAREITRTGGLIILAADCTVPLAGVYLRGCERFRLQHSGRLKESVFELFDRNQRILSDGPPEFNMSMAQALLAQHDYRIILVSPDIGQQTAQQLGFEYADTIDQALSLGKTYYPVADVHVVPAGGVILPVVEEETHS